MRREIMQSFDNLVDRDGAETVVRAIVSEMTIPQLTKLQEFFSTQCGSVEDENAILVATATLNIPVAFAVLLLAEAKKIEPNPGFWPQAMRKLKESGIKLVGDNLEAQVTALCCAAGAEALKQWARHQSTSTISRVLKAVCKPAQAAPRPVCRHREAGIIAYMARNHVGRLAAEQKAAELGDIHLKSQWHWVAAMVHGL